MQITNLKNVSKNLPEVPGIYKFIDIRGSIIYVGKAKNLKNRVSSYFDINIDPRSKTFALVQSINKIEYIEAQNEFDALVLEAELIKKYQPKYNINLKDDKSYLYIVVRNESVKINQNKIKLPLILTARKPDLLTTDEVFGPYPDAKTARFIVKTLRRALPFRDCSINKFTKYNSLQKPCLFGYINLCPAPCVSNSKQQIKKYKQNIQKIQKLLKGNLNKVVLDLEKQMKKQSMNLEYEKALETKILLDKYYYIIGLSKAPPDYMENPYIVEDQISQTLEEIKIITNITDPITRIECYDISNISGKDAVASMVVSVKGRLVNREYKRFKIHSKNTPDDFEMMREVISRRLNHEIETSRNKWGMPDLIIVDGGKGQISAALEVMEKYDIRIPVIGLAKKFETIVVPMGSEFVEINLPKNNTGLKHIISLRDEAHRFAQKYHHYLRIKSIRNS